MLFSFLGKAAKRTRWLGTAWREYSSAATEEKRKGDFF
jgi:hypothetical protein